jgi:biopolymer transport protein TolQ
LLDNIKLAADAATLSPIALFLQADIIVKAVMIGLLAASIYVWAVIFTHGRGVGKMMKASDSFERDFWRAVIDREGTRERLGIAMNSAVAGEVDRLAEKIGTLATIGSVAPFVGLFGTVWGIMRSFTAIAASNNSSLAVVAPGIAEALFATAIGLFAAIPAVIAYNAFSQRLNRLESRLGRFADGLHATFSRELEVEA